MMLPEVFEMLDPSDSFVALLQEDRRYKIEAYILIFEALNYAHHELGLGADKQSEPSTGPEAPSELSQTVERHISGQELCEAIRRYALHQYGYLAKSVLNSWGLHATGDFGEVVFNLIRIGRMKKTAADKKEDFENVYDFHTAFREKFQIEATD
ncbi:MAG: Minf_1886 family protein [Thermoguttaceae bacterium]